MRWQVEFGEQLKQAREAKGWSQDQLAEGLSVSRPQLSNYENGKSKIPANVAAEIVKKLERSLNIDGCEIAPRIEKVGPANENQLCLDFDKEHKFGPISIRPTRTEITVTTTITGPLKRA